MHQLNQKKLHRILLCLLLFGMVPGFGYSQWVNPSNGAIVEPSASVWQSMRYGNTPVSLYTGGIDLSIPIYQYEDYEFSIPIALKYVFDGQKPNNPAGPYGLGWVLNAGGAVTRQVNHFPDEYTTTDNSESMWGFLKMYEDEKIVPDLYSSGFTYLNSPSFYYKTAKNNKIEAEPDIFSFNFMGHSGKFIFWANRQIVVYETSSPKGTYKIEPVIENYKILGFRIRTVDGWCYTFGLNEKLNTNKSMIIHDYNLGAWIEDYQSRQMMWPLVSVRAPSGRTAYYEYELGDEMVTTAQPTSYITDNSREPLNDDKWTHVARINEQKQWSLFLKKIILPDLFSADFTYTNQRRLEQYRDGNGNMNTMVTDGLLKSITIRDIAGNSVVRTASMTYDDGIPNKVPFLNGVKISDLGEYVLTYWGAYDTNRTPYKGTCSIDHWGYYNGYSNTGLLTNFFPTTSINNNQETIKTSQRDPNFNEALKGALRYIYYPTRGRTEFIYEQNDYSAAIEKADFNGGNPRAVYYNNYKPAGGIRIKTIIDFDFNVRYSNWIDTLQVRTYSYEVNGTSTGILLRSPKYRSSEIPYTSIQNSTKYNYLASGDMLDCIDTDHHIEYQQVTETNRDGSYCKYIYSTYANTISEGGVSIEDQTSPRYNSIGLIFNDINKYIYMRPGSHQASRGKLLSMTMYQARQNPQQAEVPTYSEKYQYTIPVESVWSIRITRNYWYEYRIYTGECPLYQCIKTNYLDGTAISTVSNYLYDYQTGYPTQIEVKDASGKITKQDIFYATSAGSPTYGAPMPIKTQLQVKTPNDTDFKTTQINKYTYQGFRVETAFTIPRITEHWQTLLSEPKVYASDAEQDADLILTESMLPSPSRIRQYKDRAGNVTSYIYGGDNCNLLAIVKNLSYDKVRTALQNPDNLGSYSLSSEDEQALRNLPGVYVTTYSYIPLTGLASVKGPSGSRRDYGYDTNRRLQIVSGGADNVPTQTENTYRYQSYYLQ